MNEYNTWDLPWTYGQRWRGCQIYALNGSCKGSVHIFQILPFHFFRNSDSSGIHWGDYCEPTHVSSFPSIPVQLNKNIPNIHMYKVVWKTQLWGRSCYLQNSVTDRGGSKWHSLISAQSPHYSQVSLAFFPLPVTCFGTFRHRDLSLETKFNKGSLIVPNLPWVPILMHQQPWVWAFLPLPFTH